MMKGFNIPHSFSEFLYRFIRGLLYAFNFILCILALSLIIFSFWYLYEGENYHLDGKIKMIVFSLSFIFGIILLILSVFGLTGVLRESLVLSKAFLIGLTILVVSEVICIIMIYEYRQTILENASDLFQSLITQYTKDDDVRGLVDKIQSDLKCCGISSVNDWDYNAHFNCTSMSTLACSVPSSCCFNFKIGSNKESILCGAGLRKQENIEDMYKKIHITGCKYAIKSFFDYKHHLTTSISIGFLIPQIIGIFLIIGFISILQFLIVYETDRQGRLLGQFTQNTNDLKNSTKFIKVNIDQERIHSIKQLSITDLQAPRETVSKHIVLNSNNYY